MSDLIFRTARQGETVVLNSIEGTTFVVVNEPNVNHGAVFGNNEDGSMFGPYYPAKGENDPTEGRYAVVLSEPLVEAPSPSLNEYRVEALGEGFVVVDAGRVLHSDSGWFATEAEAQSAANVLNTPAVRIPTAEEEDAFPQAVIDVLVAAGVDDPESAQAQAAQQGLLDALYAVPALLPLFEKMAG
jgi:hypothetical protein